jgi:Ni,Fe-hydrogenase III small subunit/formate hydrogenlyase subunit 6/NADH:ubiquinone oxidoreductase subunit I
MLQLFKTRFEQGKRTLDFPARQKLPDVFRGRPEVHPELCAQGCNACADACPTDAITLNPLKLDLGKCLFCPACTEACPTGAIQYQPEYAQSFRRREDLVLDGSEAKLAEALDARMQKLFGRSLKLRHVAAGDCSGCAAELTALGNVVFDLGRFGIQFVASPRHADGIVISGPVTANMREALQIAYDATPAPKLVIAVGACAIGGGPFTAPPPLPFAIDLYVAGCPPHPLTLLDGMLRLLGRL